MMDIAWAIGAGVGLAALAGFRSFIPLAVYMIFARAGWTWFDASGGPFDFMLTNAAIAIPVGLAVLDLIFSRVRVAAAAESFLRPPVYMAAGALLCATAVSASITSAAHFAFLAAGAVLALLGLYVKRGIAATGEGSDAGPALDFSVIVLSVLFMPLPPAGYALVVGLLWLGWRVRKLRRLKYKGLRVLA